MTEKPRVSVIIANWNGAEHLRLCLPSLASQSFSLLEIIVVDNRSSDSSEGVARSFGARWLPLKINLGLAPALNCGAAIASGDRLLFVNNDMRFDPAFVAALVEPLERDEEIFATDGMQFNWDGTVRRHMATRLTNISPRRDSSTELVPGLYFYPQDKTEKSSVFMASAACMIVRKSFFEKLGGFDDRLPFGYEDVDICWRAWVHGWKTLYVPTAICWHRVGGSVRSPEDERFGFRGVLTGRLLLATKLLPARYAFRTWLISTAGLAKDMSRLRWKFAVDRIRVLFRMAGLVVQLLREKRALFRNPSSSPEKQLEFLLQLTDADVRAD
jgi:N-acetylglucosaminyl-diphospho-decaprenol L-rhamnosyltransferase